MEKSNLVSIYLDEEGNLAYEIGDLKEAGFELIGLLESIKMRIFLSEDEPESTTKE
jgi:hypothetical protein